MAKKKVEDSRYICNYDHQDRLHLLDESNFEWVDYYDPNQYVVMHNRIK